MPLDNLEDKIGVGTWVYNQDIGRSGGFYTWVDCEDERAWADNVNRHGCHAMKGKCLRYATLAL